jgi:hypothetical protein
VKITSDGVKATAYILVGITAVYAAYRVYSLGESTANAVGKTLDDAKNAATSLLHKIGIGWPDLAKLPSNEGYPEPAAIRRAIDLDASDTQKTIDNYNEMMNTSGVSAYLESDRSGRFSEMAQDYSPIDGPGNDRLTA